MSGIPDLPEPEAEAKGGEKGDGRTPCMHCGSPLNPGAKFCTVCELYQKRIFKSKSGLGYLTLANAGLATGVLFINLVIQQLPDSDVFADSNVSRTTERCYRDRAIVGVANRGRRFATFVGGEISSSDGVKYSLLIRPGESVIEGKKVGALDMLFLTERGSTEAFDPSDDASCKYTIKIWYQDFKPKPDKAADRAESGVGAAAVTTENARHLEATCSCQKYLYEEVMKEAQGASEVPPRSAS